MAGAKTKAKTHTQTKNGIPVGNPREPWALESDNLNLNLGTSLIEIEGQIEGFLKVQWLLYAHLIITGRLSAQISAREPNLCSITNY